MDTLERVARIRKRVEQARRDADRAEGRLEQLREELRQEFDVDSREEGEALLKKLVAARTKAEAELDSDVAEFEATDGKALLNGDMK